MNAIWLEIHHDSGISRADSLLQMDGALELYPNGDRGVNTFSPGGRLFKVSAQVAALNRLIEYAIEAIKLGSTIIAGIVTPEEVTLGAEKRVRSSLIQLSIEKIKEIDNYLACAMSGLTADARTIVDRARVTSQNHRFAYDESIKVESVTQAVCDLALRSGAEGVHDDEALMSWPFGVTLLIVGTDELGPQL
ncbi:nucleophile aminohydrolase [Cantharellus anzutake]|uniref:nucleophile aminohydrolase n=1 Tax=Cantharellus anzutake TaxID=1750568 RepID=UPI0019036739|nr:nucleophile aminohydrolase [Cantharellus anzutake]KAF8337892.1 nucleophile aminohydrolase [Cantharellus anzutake]